MSKTTIIVDDGNVSVPASKTEQPNQATSSHGFLKFLSILLFAVFVAALFIPKYLQLGSNVAWLSGSVVGKDQSVFFFVLNDMKGLKISELFTVINTHKTAWALIVCAVVLLITTIITLCTKKSAGGWFGVDCGILIIAGLPYAYICLAKDTKYIDLFLVACALALVLLIITAFVRGKGKNVVPVICFLALSVLMVLTCMYNFYPGTTERSLFVGSTSTFLNVLKGNAGKFELYQTMTYITFGVLLLCWILTVFQIGTVKKTTWFTFIRYLVLFGLALASMIIIMTNKTIVSDVGSYIKDYPYYIILVAVAFVILLLSLIAKLTAKKKVKVAEEETSDKDEKKEEASVVAQNTGADAPAYNAPVYGAPTYAAPVYAAPVYGAPTYGTPSYGPDGNTALRGQNTARGYDRNARMAPSSSYPTHAQSPYASSSHINNVPECYPYSVANQSAAYPMPNIYINITNGTNGAPAEVKVTNEEAKPAAQTAVVTTASAATATTQEQETVNEEVEKIANDLREESTEETAIVSPAPEKTVAVRETTIVQKKKTKRRSFWLFLGLLLTIAALAIYAITDWSTVSGLFTKFALKPETLLPLAFVGGGVLAVIFGFISLAGANKPCGVISFIFTVVCAVGYLVNVQLYGTNDIIKSITSLDWKFIAIAVCVILAVIFSFIGMIRTGKRKVKEEVKTETKVVSTVKKENVKANEGMKEEKTSAPTEESVVAKESEEAEAVEEEPEEVSEPEENIDDPFIKSLSVLNKREFRKTFLEGNPPSYLPEYEIGGDNTDFFDAIFVYLGKIRSVISPSLLAAVYDYMNK